MNERIRYLTSLVLSVCIGCLPVVASSRDAGKTLYENKGCEACHGNHGRKPILPVYPKLAAQNMEYLLQQMLDIKNGVRNNGQTAVMKPIIVNVTSEEMEAIAEYLAGRHEELESEQETD